MPVDIRVPSVGESITEAVLSRWLKQDGETVRVDEPVCELETEKATTEIAAPTAGILHHSTREGEKVAIGAVLGHIDEKATAAAQVDGRPQQPAPAAASAPPMPAAREKVDGQPKEPAPAAASAPLMPAARRLAQEKGIDVQGITGTGRGGRITKQDVAQHEASRERKRPEETSSAPADSSGRSRSRLAQTPPAGRESRQRMSSIRQRIAERLVAAQRGAASLTTFNEADLSAVQALRSRYKDRFKEKHGVGLGFMAFFVKAVVEALRAYPIVNARIDGSDIVYQHIHDIGVAVSTERGLMVPIVRDAGRLGFADIEKAIAALAAKARDGKIAVGDLQGGTFTITNGGVFGSLLSTPILNAPQSAILGMHTIQKRPVAVNDQVVIRPMMYLALTYDHRLIDGRDAVLFLVRVKECIEDPERLLLEV